MGSGALALLCAGSGPPCCPAPGSSTGHLGPSVSLRPSPAPSRSTLSLPATSATPVLLLLRCSLSFWLEVAKMPLRKNTSGWRAEGGRRQETPAQPLAPSLPGKAMDLGRAKPINEICMLKQR